MVKLRDGQMPKGLLAETLTALRLMAAACVVRSEPVASAWPSLMHNPCNGLIPALLHPSLHFSARAKSRVATL
ncbi:hypothetical protein BN2476_730034 [Paraburkholderia piptadeniae]|uniref:Uncharacterized protein n=1 Tax=Paraburkholderia piptadeniae TaxID=1701573 RepID=A0A1N7SR70_9BURK|nr:hypothetical protein BN2476_730034 [Paraburkholderia piptadeniae]